MPKQQVQGPADHVKGSVALARVNRLSDACWAFSTLAAALEVGLLQALTKPLDLRQLAIRTGMSRQLVVRMLDVLAALHLVHEKNGRWSAVSALQPMLAPRVINVWRADIRSGALQATQLFEAARRGRVVIDGWRQSSPELMQSQGLVSAASTHFLVISAFRRITGLLESLQRPGATFLDVGAGAGGSALALAEAFPRLRIVALEPGETALRLARRNVQAAGFRDRIELRQQRVETLSMSEIFDGAYIAQAFMPDRTLAAGLKTVRAALRPGGWLLSTSASVAGASLAAASMRLRNELWGGGARLASELVSRFTSAGYVNVTEIGVHASARLVVGRRSQRRGAP